MRYICILFLFPAAIHGHHVQNIPNDSLMNQTVAAMQHNSHMVSRVQPSHPVHSVTVNQNPGSRLQVRFFFFRSAKNMLLIQLIRN